MTRVPVDTHHPRPAGGLTPAGRFAPRRTIAAAPRRGGTGFTLIELLVVVVIVAALLSILLPGLGAARASAQDARCLTQLRQLATGFRLFAEDHAGRLPEGDDAMLWFLVLQTYVDEPDLFVCPQDPDASPESFGLSYAWRDALAVTSPAASLEGAPIDATMSGDLALVFDALPGWHGDDTVQAARLDGSAQRWALEAFEADLARPVW